MRKKKTHFKATNSKIKAFRAAFFPQLSLLKAADIFPFRTLNSFFFLY